MLKAEADTCIDIMESSSKNLVILSQHVFSKIHDAMILLMDKLMGKLKIAKYTQLTHLTRPNTNWFAVCSRVPHAILNKRIYYLRSRARRTGNAGNGSRWGYLRRYWSVRMPVAFRKCVQFVSLVCYNVTAFVVQPTEQHHSDVICAGGVKISHRSFVNWNIKYLCGNRSFPHARMYTILPRIRPPVLQYFHFQSVWKVVNAYDN